MIDILDVIGRAENGASFSYLRVMPLRLEADADRLDQLIFGPDRPTRVVMLTHKESVAAALLAIAP